MLKSWNSLPNNSLHCCPSALSGVHEIANIALLLLSLPI